MRSRTTSGEALEARDGSSSPSRRRAISNIHLGGNGSVGGSGSFDRNENSTFLSASAKSLSAKFSKDRSVHSIYSGGSPTSSPRSNRFPIFGSQDESGESSSAKSIRKRLSLQIREWTGDGGEEGDDRIEELRIWLKAFFEKSFLGYIYRNCLLFMSIFSCLQFLVHTYSDPYPRSDNRTVGKVNGEVVETMIACVFAFDWALSLFISDQRGIFLTSFFSMVDLLTVIPTFIMYSEQCPYMDDVHSWASIMQFILCGLKMTRILRILRLHKRFIMIEDEIQRFLASMALNIVVMIIFNSAVMHYLEPDQGYSFHTWVYYMIVTCTTVGYGDISPKSDVGRFAAMTMISFAIITVPSMTNELISKMSQQSIYARAKYIPKTAKSRHVLICGDSSSSSLREFFEELFHEDHDVTNLYAVILQPGYPNSDVMKLLKDVDYQQTLTYLDGSAMNEQDLRRALAHQAKAIFILTNKFTTNPDEEDAKTILQSYSIRRFFNLHSTNHSVSVSKTESIFSRLANGVSSVLFDGNASSSSNGTIVCMQLLLPDNRRHVVSTANNNKANANNGDGANENLVVCLNETKMGVIAKACIFQGTNTLIMNLLSSFADNDEESGATNDKDNDDISILDEDQDSGDWLGEYQRGCTWEIYTSEVSPAFEGLSFCGLSEVLYSKLGVVLFGLEVEDLPVDNRGNGRANTKHSKKMVLNPGNYIIPSTKDGSKRLTALIIAQNKTQSDISFKDDDENSMLQRSVDFRQLALLTNSAQGGVTVVGSGSGIVVGNRRRSLLSFAQRPGLYSRKPSRSIVAATDEDSIATRESKEEDRYDIGDPVDGSVGRASAWQSLLRSYEKLKTSEQLLEELQQREEKYMKKHYYLRSGIANNMKDGKASTDEVVVEVSDVMIATNVIEELPMMKDHIIITGKSLNNLYDCIRPLRARNLGPLKHIVILFPREFPPLVWQKISVFESIWVVRGSSLEDADLIRCGIFRAKQVLLLADSSAAANALVSSSGSSASMQGNEFSADADIIFSYHAVKRLNPAIHVVVEMVRASNMHYLTATSSEERNSSAAVNNDYKFTPQFASGALFLTSFLDTLVCQSFYNTRIVDIVHKMIVGEAEDEMDGTSKTAKSTDAAASNTPATPVQRDPRRSTFINVKSINAKGAPSIKDASANRLKGSSLYQIPIPEGLTNRTYGALFKLLVTKNMIPLGLLRGVVSSTKTGPKGNKVPYVFTNPSPDSEIFACDKVFVLAQQTPTLVRAPTGSSPSEGKSDENPDGPKLKKKKTSTNDVMSALTAMKKEVDQFQQVQGQFEFRLQQMYGEFSQNLNLVSTMVSQYHQTQQELKDQRNVRFNLQPQICPNCVIQARTRPSSRSLPGSARPSAFITPPRYRTSSASIPSSPGSTAKWVESKVGSVIVPQFYNNYNDGTTITGTSVVTYSSDVGGSLTTPVKTENSLLSLDGTPSQESSQPCVATREEEVSTPPIVEHVDDDEVRSVPSSVTLSPRASPSPVLSDDGDKITNRPNHVPIGVDNDHEHSSAMVSAPVTYVVRPKSASRSEFHF